MDGWLVVARGEMDDLPIRMFETLEEAVDTVAQISDDNICNLAGDVALRLAWPIPELIAIEAIELVDGFVVNYVTLRDFD